MAAQYEEAVLGVGLPSSPATSEPSSSASESLLSWSQSTAASLADVEPTPMIWVPIAAQPYSFTDDGQIFALGPVSPLLVDAPLDATLPEVLQGGLGYDDGFGGAFGWQQADPTMFGGRTSETSEGAVVSIFNVIGDGTYEKDIASRALQLAFAQNLSGTYLKARELEKCDDDDIESMAEVCRLDYKITLTLNSLQTTLRDAVVVPALWDAKSRWEALTMTAGSDGEPQDFRSVFRGLLQEQFEPYIADFAGSILEDKILGAVKQLILKYRNDLKNQGYTLAEPWTSSNQAREQARREIGKKRNKKNNKGQQPKKD
mmetsp:Transcript_12610/g.35438  ORF Transcript_12610/g.35438 Transcript_12610/m.35438 type:complete len:316 (+) Transcript_12610:61-1008(+)